MVKKEINAIIDISGKSNVFRTSVATGLLNLSSQSSSAVKSNSLPKGDVLEASTVAVIQAVKLTPSLIPHCHPIPLEACKVDWNWEGDNLRCTVKVSANYKTGVEMEALTGVSVGLLCVWDMVKSVEKDEKGQYPNASITDIRVLEKNKDS